MHRRRRSTVVQAITIIVFNVALSWAVYHGWGQLQHPFRISKQFLDVAQEHCWLATSMLFAIRLICSMHWLVPLCSFGGHGRWTVIAIVGVDELESWCLFFVDCCVWDVVYALHAQHDAVAWGSEGVDLVQFDQHYTPPLSTSSNLPPPPPLYTAYPLSPFKLP